ncbi:hypothetical protein H2200_012738 [Cladophialophora chaetospira]|uniref:Extracellular membrane protein CFEM domain-containing protein n=1 Tax=Cladophialophora chaetospira TaxID=386627 RepID=A0AA39CC76_9EURO|nr:hypothetical protein H2200_012738 [Cladophialophora chaetospira]
MELRRRTGLALSILLYTLIETSSATASFSAIQPIVGFSTSCTLAYNTPVSRCDINDFQGVGGKGSCSADCQSSLIASQIFVQRLCAGQQADGSSVIGHLFTGDIVNFLCGDNNAAAPTAATTQANTAATQATTQANTAATQATTQSSMSMASNSVSSTTKTSSSGSAASNASVSGTTLATSTSSQSTKASSSTSNSIPTSTESETSSLPSASSSSRSSSTSSSASATRTSNSGGSTSSDSGGGSPFDGTFVAAASQQTLQPKLLILSCIVALILAVSCNG